MADGAKRSIGALWARTSKKGTDFFSGKIEGIGDVVVFANADKEDGDKRPDWKIFKSEPRE
jgi:uncharacterized protein (DUF736 family)